MTELPDSRIKYRHLRFLVECVRTGTLAEAAGRTGVTPSAASKTLKELEDIVGERLVERNRRGLTLTPAGEVLHRYASASLTALHHGVDLIAKARSELRASVLVGALPNVAAQVMPAAVTRFKERMPQVPVRMAAGMNRQLMTQLRNGELDFVVGRLAEPDEMMGLHFERLYFERFALVARPGHPLEGATEFTEENLGRFTMILPSYGTVIRPEIDRFMIGLGISHFPDVMETLSPDFSKAFVRRTDALWLVPYGVVRTDLLEGRLRELDIDLSSTGGPVGISTLAEAGLSAQSRVFASCVREAAAQYASVVSQPR